MKSEKNKNDEDDFLEEWFSIGLAFRLSSRFIGRYYYIFWAAFIFLFTAFQTKKGVNIVEALFVSALSSIVVFLVLLFSFVILFGISSFGDGWALEFLEKFTKPNPGKFLHQIVYFLISSLAYIFLILLVSFFSSGCPEGTKSWACQ